MAGVRKGRQEVLDHYETHVELERFEVREQLQVFKVEYSRQDLDVGSQREHVGVVVPRYDLFDEVGQSPETLLRHRDLLPR